MVAGHAGQAESAAPAREEAQRAAVVDPVQAALGEEGRKGSARPPRRAIAAGGGAKGEPIQEDRLQLRAPVIEVAPHETRHIRGESGELPRPREHAHLVLPLAGGEAQVQVEDLQRMASAIRAEDGNAGVLAPPPLAGAHREVDVALALDRVAAQGGVPVAALPQGDVMADGQVAIAQPSRQFTGQVHLPGARHPLVHLLQEDDVGIMGLEDAGDPFRSKAAIHTNGPMDVVAEHAQSHGPADPRGQTLPRDEFSKGPTVLTRRAGGVSFRAPPWPASSFASSTWGRATEAGSFRKTRAPCRASSNSRSGPCPGAPTSSSTDRGGRTPGYTPFSRSPIWTSKPPPPPTPSAAPSTTSCPRTSISSPWRRCRAASMPATGRRRAATSTRSRGGALPSPSRSYAGSTSRCTWTACDRPRASSLA